MPRKRRGWLKVLGGIVVLLVVLVIAVYFVATSSAFLKGVILPRVSKSMGGEVTVSDASISPFKEVILRHLQVQTTGAEPLLTTAEVHLRYSLMDMIGGRINIDEASVSGATVTLVQNADGTSNLDPLLKAQKAKPQEKKPGQPKPSGKQLQVNVRKVALTDATVRRVKLYAGGTRDVTELSHVNVTLEDLQNGQAGKLTLAADISVANNPPAPAGKGLLQAKLAGDFSFALTPDLKPGSIKGSAHLAVSQAGGALSQMAGFGSEVVCELTPTEIKQITLSFQRAGTPLGQLLVRGLFDAEKSEGRLSVEVRAIDKRLLNMVGESSGTDFGSTTISSSNSIEFSKGGKAITVGGQLDVGRLQVTRTNTTTPPLDFQAQYIVTIDQDAKTALLQKLTLTGTQNANPLLQADLASPMTVSWGDASNNVGDSTLNLAVTHLDLADWKAFLGDVAPTGIVNAKMKLLSQQAGKQLTFDLSSQIDNLTAGSGANQITQASVTLQMNGKATDLKQFSVPEYKLQIARLNEPLGTVSGSVTYDQATQNADVTLNAQLMLARLLQALPLPGMSASSGTAELKLHVTQAGQSVNSKAQTPGATQGITGSFALADFTGQFGGNSLRSFGITADVDVAMTPKQVQIHKAAGRFTQDSAVGGAFDLSGTYDLTNKSAQLTVKLTGFNQAGLGPFLQPMLGDKKLVSVAINGNASVQYEPQAASTVKGDLQMTNLVVNDPSGRLPAKPFEASVQVDVGLNKQVATVRQFQISLTPTARATNQVQLTGEVDMSQTNTIQGSLKLAVDSLDVTSYYDLFAAQKKATAVTTPKAAPAPTETGKESAPVKLPFHNFTAEANVRKFYLHEMEITNLTATAKLDGGHVVLNPFKLALNGAPVSATVDLDLGMPGYKYDATFNAKAVPLPPLVNTFQPERKGQIGGTFTAQATVSGQGTTGASLQKTLNGQFDASSTNLNLSVANFKNLILKKLIDVVSTIPELTRNPASAITSFLPGTSGTGGLANELTKSPVDSIIARGTMGSGRVDLEQAVVQSAAFRAEAAGTITLAAVLTNSTIQIPVSISLSRPIAEKLNLVPANTPTNAAYAKLPDFFTERGTIGEPQADINKGALAGLVLQSITSGVPAAGSKVSGVLQGLGGLLGGGVPSTENPPPNAATNQPASKQELIGNLLNNLLKPRK